MLAILTKVKKCYAVTVLIPPDRARSYPQINKKPGGANAYRAYMFVCDFPLWILACRKAANEYIPRSIDNYVTGVYE